MTFSVNLIFNKYFRFFKRHAETENIWIVKGYIFFPHNKEIDKKKVIL